MKNNLRLILIVAVLMCRYLILKAQPADYYRATENLSGTELKQALHDIIDNHTSLSYQELWNVFQYTDKKDNGTVWDMYGDTPAGIAPYNYTFITNQCGNYSTEGDCYNREHSFPKSWFNGEVAPMYTDLNHLFPTDGYVNNRRSNYPYGETNQPSWTSLNGSKLGTSSVHGYSGIVFEPIDEYKGDFARAYLYMAVRYFGEDSGWEGSDMTEGSQPVEWALKMLLEWHKNDPVSTKEQERNDEVFDWQNNRNPFIDEPSFADRIWNTTDILKTSAPVFKLEIYPNPASEELTISLNDWQQKDILVNIYSASGCLISSFSLTNVKQEYNIDISHLNKGSYIISLRTGKKIYHARFIKL